jgi:RsiW-degrading membrane proteinase PrsW (M82 family)
VGILSVKKRYLVFGVGYISLLFFIVTYTNPSAAYSIPITLLGPGLLIYLTGKISKESFITKNTVVTALLLGGGICTFTAGVLNAIASVFFPDYIITVIFAPFAEELLKIGCLFLLRGYIVSPSNGALYGLYVGAGFTVVEDILYLANTTNASEALGTSLTRLLFNPFLHMVCTSLIGWVFGTVRSQGRAKKGLMVQAYFLAVVLHGIWNLLASSGYSIVWIYGISYTLALFYILERSIAQDREQIDSKLEQKSGKLLLSVEKNILNHQLVDSRGIDTINWARTLYRFIFAPPEKAEDSYAELVKLRSVIQAQQRYAMLNEKVFEPLIPGVYLTHEGWRRFS